MVLSQALPMRGKSQNGLSILCVDDDVDIRTIVKLSLQLDASIDVELAENGDHALRLLVSPSYYPDCILLDIEMPKYDGKLLFGEIRALKHHRTTPVIFLTAHVTLQHHKDCLALGAAGLISKPFDPVTLAAQIKALLGQGPV